MHLLQCPCIASRRPMIANPPFPRNWTQIQAPHLTWHPSLQTRPRGPLLRSVSQAALRLWRLAALLGGRRCLAAGLQKATPPTLPSTLLPWRPLSLRPRRSHSPQRRRISARGPG